VDSAHGSFGGRLGRRVIVVGVAVVATVIGVVAIGIGTVAALFPVPIERGRRELVHSPFGVVDAQPKLKVVSPQLFQLVDELRRIVYRGRIHVAVVVVVVLVNDFVVAIVQPTVTEAPVPHHARSHRQWRS